MDIKLKDLPKTKFVCKNGQTIDSAFIDMLGSYLEKLAFRGDNVQLEKVESYLKTIFIKKLK